MKAEKNMIEENALTYDKLRITNLKINNNNNYYYYYYPYWSKTCLFNRPSTCHLSNIILFFLISIFQLHM